MASKRPLLPRNGQIRLLVAPGKLQKASICPFCSLAPLARTKRNPRRSVALERCQSTISNTTAATNPRAELERTLEELREQIPSLINLSRLQLALQGLRQAPGEEAIRVAILGLENGSGTADIARRVVATLLADPLNGAQQWEQEIQHQDLQKPLVVRIGPVQSEANTLSISKDDAISELHVSSPALNRLNLELLLMNVTAPYGPPGSLSAQALQDAALAPTVDVPSSETRLSPVTTPVHRALFVTKGFAGAVNVSVLPVAGTNGAILAAVDMKGLPSDQLDAPFNIIDVSQAEKGITLFRQGPQNGLEYKRLWFDSNIPALMTWLKSGATTSGQETKPAVRQLIASLLQNTVASIENAESQRGSGTLKPGSSSSTSLALKEVVDEWAQKAHTELQQELDLAFTGRRWRKLGWWKLFWRVDDVAMLTNEMLSQRFLPTAEQKLVYLTGRIAGTGDYAPQYPQPVSQADKEGVAEGRKLGSGEIAPAIVGTTASALPKWPGHIAFTRRYLQNETVPALQSLAQKLVIQSLGTSSVTTALATLLYVSSFASTVYEAGAVAALGIVYSLSRMQKKWETARGFWEGEVREEGRKAVRAAEESVTEALQGKANGLSIGETETLEKARGLVAKAEEALAKMK